MSDQTQTAAGERLDEARDRLHLEGLGDHALSVVESAADGALDAQLKQDGRLEPLRTQLATLSATVNEATLAADGSRRPVRDLDTAQLEDISQELMNTLEESSEPGIPARIHAADSGRDMLARLNNAEAALQAFDYTTPQNPEMIEFAGIDTQTRRVSREQLERTTRQSLEFLERSHIMGVDFAQSPVAAEHHVLLDNLDAAGYLLPGESAARNEPLSQQKIRGSDAQLLSIANAASGLAMELDQDTLAKLPIEEGSSRFGGLSRIALGDEANRLKSTLTAAGYVADAHQPVDSEALAPAVVVDTRDYTFSIVQRDRIVDLPKGADEAAMRDHLMINYSDDKLLAVLNHVPVQAHTHGEAVEALHTHLADSALKRDQVVVLGSGNQELPLGAFDQVETALAEGRDPDAVMPRAERGRAGLTDRQANAMADLLETGVKVTGEAQFDTDDHNKVRFSAALLDQIRKAENDVKVTRADDAIMRIAREEVASASIKPEGARDIYEAATAIGDVSDFAAKVSKADAVVDQKKMDSAIYAVDVALQSGAANAVSGLAKRDAINRNAMEGFGAGSQTSVIDGLAQGHTPAPDSNEQLRSLNGAKPEMTAAYYRTLPASEQKRCRAYVMEPGKGFFDNYHTVSASFCAEVPRYRVNRLRAYIRDKMVNQDGAPNHRNLSVLASLSMDDRGRKGAFPGRAIVAPHLDEAKVIRQESERAGAILDAERQRQQQQFREQLPKATVSFERDQLAGLVRKLEASGSEVPVTLVKRDDRLSLEHPEAPTAASQPSTDEAVHKMRDGYRLTKVSADQLSQAVQSTPEGRAVQMHLEADRVSAMGPVQPAQKKRAVAAKSDEDMAI